MIQFSVAVLWKFNFFPLVWPLNYQKYHQRNLYSKYFPIFEWNCEPNYCLNQFHVQDFPKRFQGTSWSTMGILTDQYPVFCVIWQNNVGCMITRLPIWYLYLPFRFKLIDSFTYVQCKRKSVHLDWGLD